MEFNLRKARESIGLSAKDAARAAGITESFYRKNEKDRKLPCKYLYKIWKEYPEYPLPADFFWYTSFTLKCNLNYHNITQKEAAKILQVSSQALVSKYLSTNIPMYEYKEIFDEAFVPLIVPMVEKNNGSLKYMTDLEPAGNLMMRHKKNTIRAGDKTKTLAKT